MSRKRKRQTTGGGRYTPPQRHRADDVAYVIPDPRRAADDLCSGHVRAAAGADGEHELAAMMLDDYKARICGDLPDATLAEFTVDDFLEALREMTPEMLDRVYGPAGASPEPKGAGVSTRRHKPRRTTSGGRHTPPARLNSPDNPDIALVRVDPGGDFIPVTLEDHVTGEPWTLDALDAARSLHADGYLSTSAPEAMHELATALLFGLALARHGEAATRAAGNAVATPARIATVIDALDDLPPDDVIDLVNLLVVDAPDRPPPA